MQYLNMFCLQNPCTKDVIIIMDRPEVTIEPGLSDRSFRSLETIRSENPLSRSSTKSQLVLTRITSFDI